MRPIPNLFSRGLVRHFAMGTLALGALGACGEDDKKTDVVDATTADGDADATPDGETSNDPGAIIRTTLTSTVGVMLDELPEGAFRDRVAGEIIAKDDAFWIERAKAQLELTHYRLTFRAAYYDEAEGKGALNLPPPSVWQIDLAAGGAKRQTIDGHDYVAVEYSLTSAVLSDVASPVESDPAFAEIGGKAEEEFILPVDPELVFQRSGFACMDEAEFPPSSVDGENVATYYDHECTAVEDAPPKERCHATEAVTEDCVDALTTHIGKVTTTITFERVPWVEADAAPFRVSGWTSTVGVDVQPVAEALDKNYLVYKYIPADHCAVIEDCVAAPGWRRLLRFDAFLKNTGQADMEIGDVDYFIASTEGDTTLLGRHNIFEYSACHDHYHFKHYGQFDLEAGNADVSGSKRAFCLETGTRHFNDEHTPTVTAYSGCHFQGLTRGWGDEYGANLDCQWYDVTGVDTSAGPVPVELQFSANPDGFLCEGNPVLDGDGKLTFEPTDFKTENGEPVDRPVCDFIPDWDANNFAKTDATLPQVGGLITSECTRGQVGPLRDCGFVAGPRAVVGGATDACSGDTATVSCTNSGTEPAVVRVCEASAKLATGVACVYRDALGSAIIPPGGAPTSVTFACPGGRDLEEPGGRFALYSGSVFPDDALGAVSCSLAE